MFHISVPIHPFILKTSVLICVMLSAFCCSIYGSDEEKNFEVVCVRFLGSVWNQGHAEASVVSQDGGYSYIVPGGSLWWFGDTFKGSRDKTGKPNFSGGAVSCSVALLNETNKCVPPVLNYLLGQDGKVAQAITFLPEESWEHHRIWPLGGVYVNGKSYIYYSLIELTGKGEWDFKSAGSGLACSAQPLSLHKRIQTAEGWRFPVSPTAVVTTDDWIFLYDVERRGDQQGVWLSRVTPKEIENPNDYQFYCGPGPNFSRDKNKQLLFMKDIYGQVSIVWNEYLKKYILASSSDFFHPREIRFHTANEPFGPWSNAVANVTVPEYIQGKKVRVVYCSYLHPELFRENGRIMNLTFSVNLQDSAFDVNNEVVEIEVKPFEK